MIYDHLSYLYGTQFYSAGHTPICTKSQEAPICQAEAVQLMSLHKEAWVHLCREKKKHCKEFNGFSFVRPLQSEVSQKKRIELMQWIFRH